MEMDMLNIDNVMLDIELTKDLKNELDEYLKHKYRYIIYHYSIRYIKINIDNININIGLHSNTKSLHASKEKESGYYFSWRHISEEDVRNDACFVPLSDPNCTKIIIEYIEFLKNENVICASGGTR